MKYAINLMDTSFTMCTHVVDVLCLGSLLCQVLYRECHAHMQGLAVQDMSLIFMQASILLQFFPPGRGYCIVFRSSCFFLGSVPSNDVARDASPVKVGAGTGNAKGCSVGAGLWRPQSSL